MIIEISATILIILIVAIVSLLTVIAVNIDSLKRSHDENTNKKEEDPEKDIKLREAKIVYSNNLLSYTKTLIAEISAIEFKKFCDQFEFGKITMSHLKPVISDIATKTTIAIQFDQIDFMNVMFTQEFLEKYIIEVSIMYVKKLFEQRLDSY